MPYDHQPYLILLPPPVARRSRDNGKTVDATDLASKRVVAGFIVANGRAARKVATASDKA